MLLALAYHILHRIVYNGYEMVPGNTGVDGLLQAQREALHDGNSSAKMGIPSKFEDRWINQDAGRSCRDFWGLKVFEVEMCS